MVSNKFCKSTRLTLRE